MWTFSLWRIIPHHQVVAQRLRQPITSPIILLHLRSAERREIAQSSSLCRHQRRVGDRDEQSPHQLVHGDGRCDNTPSADCEPSSVLGSQ